MTRLHISMSDGEDDFRTAASRIHELMTVDINEAPDAIVTDDNQFGFEEKPVLLVNAEPLHDGPWLFPALPGRFAPDVQAIANSLHSGKLGEPGLIRLHQWSSSSRSRSGTGKVEAVDLARWLFNRDPDSIHGVSSDACSLIHLGFPGGGMAMLDFTETLKEGEGYRSISLIGSRGAAYSDDHRNRNLLFAGGAPEASSPYSEPAFIQPMLEAFIENVRRKNDSCQITENYNAATEIVTAAFTRNSDR